MEKRIAIYLRVSTQNQNTGLQRKEIEAFLSARDWQSWVIYEDHFTGTSVRRPALGQLMKDARERKIDLVICWKICRIARSLKDLVSLLQEFQELGVEFVSLKDQIDLTTSSGRLLTHLLGAFAEFEASLIRERVVSGLNHAKLKGVRLGRPPSISESEVMRLRQQGLSLTQIAQQVGATKGGVSKTLKKMNMQLAEKTNEEFVLSAVEQTSV